MDLEKVANVIVDHSLQDCVFSKEAGRMCYAIIQVGWDCRNAETFWERLKQRAGLAAGRTGANGFPERWSQTRGSSATEAGRGAHHGTASGSPSFPWLTG